MFFLRRRPSAGCASARDEHGFTLVEIVVVVLVLGVLVAVAIPSFAGASGRASRRSVEAELRSSVPSALTLAQEAPGSFSVGDRAIVATDLAVMEPGLTFAAAGTSEVIGVVTSEDRRTLWLDKVDAKGVRVTLAVGIGRGLRFCAGGDPEDCAIDTASDRASRRRDGDTPAADHRRNAP